MTLLAQLLTAVGLYLTLSAIAVIGIALCLLFGERSIRLWHLVAAKVIGITVLGALLWWATVLSLFPYASSVALRMFVGAVMLGALGVIGHFQRRGRVVWPGWRSVIRLEIVAVGLLLVYLTLRSAFAQLDSTEKFMDLALLQAAMRTDEFPFADFWRAGLPVNYYYFGYVPLAVLLRLPGIDASLGYNLVLGLVFVLSLQLCYLFVRAATGSRVAAAVGAGLTMLGGNLHYAACMTSAAFGGQALEVACYYPKVSRVLEPSFTINEMPAYSFFLGDLHPHVISIPWFLVTIGLVWHYARSAPGALLPAASLIIALALAAVIHAWDFMTLGVLLIIALLATRIAQNAWRLPPWPAVSRDAAVAATAAIGPFILFAPFFLQFSSPVAGIGYAPEFVQTAGLVGSAQYPSGAVFLLRFWGGLWVPSAIAVLCLLCCRQHLSSSVSCALTLLGAALLLVFVTELLFFKDLFHIVNPPYFRVNTVFKFGYHAWILSALASSILMFSAWRGLRYARRARQLFQALCAVCIFAAVLFPLEAARQLARPSFPGTPGFARLTLDGSQFLAQRSPADSAAVDWLQAEERGRAIVIEAVGPSYSAAGRIGVFSGLVNIVNWPVHQWTWRFAYPPGVDTWSEARLRLDDTGRSAVDAIAAQVSAIYEADSIEAAWSALAPLGARYLYVGDLERETYSGLDASLLRALGEVVLDAGSSFLVRISPEPPDCIAASACLSSAPRAGVAQ